MHSADRVDTAPPPSPQKQVSETDLYLLRAIEKLVYRVDLMEKRMRKMEENVHYIVAGAEAKPGNNYVIFLFLFLHVKLKNIPFPWENQMSEVSYMTECRLQEPGQLSSPKFSFDK